MLCSCFPWGSFKTNDCNTSSIFCHSSNNTASYRQRNPQFSRHLSQSLQPAVGWPLAPAVPGSSRLTRLQLPTAPAPGRRRRRLLPFLLPRGEPQVANPTDLTIRFCKITHKDLPFAPAPPSLAPGRPARSTKCPSLLPGLARRNAGWGCFVSPLAQCKDLGNLKPHFGYSPARSCHFTKLARWEK